MDTSSRISSRFDRFIANICPSQEQLQKADQTVAVLRERLTERVAADNRFHLEKIFRAGSSAKHTNLIRTEEGGGFDIDIGVYYRAQGKTKEELDKLLTYTHVCLLKMYPEKRQEDIHKGKNAVNVFFRTSKLKVDVVPIIRDLSLKRKNSRRLTNRGLIPREDERRLTSITAHIGFVHRRTAQSKLVPGPVKFNHLVRLMKWWNRRLPENVRQCSYFCELITAAALEEQGVTNAWQSSLFQIFTFLSDHAFSRPIIFSDYYDAQSVKRPDHLVVVLDAVNPDNNVAKKWNQDIKRDYLNKLRETRDRIKQAQSYERTGREDAAVEIWCQVFGDDFGA